MEPQVFHALATQARLVSIDRATTVALQRSLLPGRLGMIDGIDAAGRYVPGAEVGVGGDWYDLFALPSGRVGAVIGDVAGNGLQAAAVMSRIRSALRAYALESNDPADVLTRLDRKIQTFEPDAMATVIYACSTRPAIRPSCPSPGTCHLSSPSPAKRPGCSTCQWTCSSAPTPTPAAAP
jgi:serine phosphatase RsbU (regulator of sigma subunit)